MMRILLLDDEPIELEQLEFLINYHFPAWKVEHAANGTQAIRLAEQKAMENEEFQLALVDIRLPGKNGLEIADQLKAIMPGLDIIVVSAFQEFEYARKSLQLKAVDYLVKPVIEKELVHALKKYADDHPLLGGGSDVINKVITMMKNRYHEPLKLSQVAEELYINPNYLGRLFSEEVGMSFSDFLLDYRIKMAKNLLVKKKDWNIQRISEACGFNSQHYFSTSFKKMTKLTPKKFRDLAS